MPQALASNMARTSLHVLLETVEQERDLASDEARELFASCEIAAFVLDKLWELAQAFLDRGMERKQLLFLLKEFLEVVDLGVKAFDAAQEKVKAADLTPLEKAEGGSLLERMSRNAAEMREELSSLSQRLDRVPPPVDESSLPGGRGAQENQGYIDLDDLTARLLSTRDE